MFSWKQVSALLIFAALIIGCAGSGWATRDIPQDPNYLFAWGEAESRQLQLAFNKAELNARAVIARELETKLNNLQKSFAEEIGAGRDMELLTMYTEATKAVTSAQLIGSKVRKQEHKEGKEIYKVRVFIEYPIGEANSALMAQIKRNQNLYIRFRASEGFKELDDEVRKYEEYKKSQGQY